MCVRRSKALENVADVHGDPAGGPAKVRYCAVTHEGEIVVGDEVEATRRRARGCGATKSSISDTEIDAEIAGHGNPDRGRQQCRKLRGSRDGSIFLRQLATLIGRI